ncbi:unnamed protein product [Adineta steineri]|uniref:Uncharacterized protein n=1 Tax=Adineta steineri TaxID=433720 RepID=A0A819VEB8_9BILA|nr:unnamed protein product [Adineta steineri]
MLIVHVQHGLSNRLRAMASGMAVSNKTGRHLRLIWIPDEHCNARFQDLFSSNIDVWDEILPHEVAAENFDRYNYMEPETGAVKNKQILTDSLNHIYVKTAYMLNHAEVKPSTIQEAFSKLILVPHIAAMVDTVNTTKLIGVHIRNADPRTEFSGIKNSTYTPAGWKQLLKSRMAMTFSIFAAEIDSILEKDPTQRFFLATDSKKITIEFKNKYKNQIDFLKKNDCRDRSKRCLAFAVADIWILSRTKELLGSTLSSFSEIVGLIGNRTVKYAGLHFPNLPSDHRTRAEVKGKGNGIIYIAYSSAKNWRIESEAEWRTQELLQSAQSIHRIYKGNVTIALFKDKRTKIPEDHKHLFKFIYLVNVSRTFEGEFVKDVLKGVAKGKKKQVPVSLGKLQQLAMSPFEITLYLDSDTWFCEKFGDFDRILGNHDIMFSKDAHIKSKTHWAWNSGVILYRNCPAVIKFFRLWEELYLQDCILSAVGRQDTCALTSALERSPLLRYGSLDSVYNLRLSNENWADQHWKFEKLRTQIIRWPVKVLHTSRIIQHQSNETCRIANKRRFVTRILGVTSSKQPTMYYTKAECVRGTENNCDVDFF